MRKWILPMFVLIVLGLGTASAAAQGLGTAPESIGSALEQLAVAIVTVLAGVLMWLAPRLVRKAEGWFEAKTQIDLPAVAIAQIDALALKAIGFAEEQARKQTKRLGSTKLPDKMELAARFFVDFAVEHGAVGWSTDKAKRYIEAKLSLERQRRGDLDELAAKLQAVGIAAKVQ